MVEVEKATLVREVKVERRGKWTSGKDQCREREVMWGARA